MDDANEWVPCGIAYMVIGDEFARMMGCDPGEGRNAAAVELIGMLEIGRLSARAQDGWFNFDQELEWSRAKMLQEVDSLSHWLTLIHTPLFEESYNLPRQRKYSGATIIPKAFWTFAERPLPTNWATGTFYTQGSGAVFGLQFALSDLPYGETVRDFIASAKPQTACSRQRQPGGAPPAHWWAAFAEEMAVCIHEEGAPAGHGAASQMFDAIQARLASAGRPSPQSRSSVREVISNVLNRIHPTSDA